MAGLVQMSLWPVWRRVCRYAGFSFSEFNAELPALRITSHRLPSFVQVEMSRKVKLVADTLIEKLKGQSFDLIALPGDPLCSFLNSKWTYLQKCS